MGNGRAIRRVVRRAVVEIIVETFVRRLYGQCMGNCRAVRKDDAEPVVRCIGDSMDDGRAVVEPVVETMQNRS